MLACSLANSFFAKQNDLPECLPDLEKFGIGVFIFITFFNFWQIVLLRASQKYLARKKFDARKIYFPKLSGNW